MAAMPEGTQTSEDNGDHALAAVYDLGQYATRNAIAKFLDARGDILYATANENVDGMGG